MVTRVLGTVRAQQLGRNSRVAALQKRWDRLRSGLDLILQKRRADMADLPGGAGGLLVRELQEALSAAGIALESLPKFSRQCRSRRRATSTSSVKTAAQDDFPGIQSLGIPATEAEGASRPCRAPEPQARANHPPLGSTGLDL